MQKINLLKNKSFCILPFIHLHVNETNDIRVCCHDIENNFKKYTNEFNFVNDTDMQAIRENMLRGDKVSHCKYCYKLEEGGVESSRIRHTREWQVKLNIKHYEEVAPSLVFYDIRNDNTCNLSCRMCFPTYSVQLEKEYKKIGWYWPEAEKSYGFTQLVDFATVKKIYVAGGEPTIMPEFRSFLNKAIEQNRTDIELCINTNATNLNKEYLEVLGKFKNLNIVVSIDGYGDVNKYIRWPSDWETITSNIKNLLKLTSNVSFNITVSIWNITNLSKLILFLDQEFPACIILLNEVLQPIYNKFTTYPNKDIVLSDLEKIRDTNRYKNDLAFKKRIDYISSEIENSEIDLDDLTDFFNYNDALDQSRNIKLKDFIPELEECRSLIKKPI